MRNALIAGCWTLFGAVLGAAPQSQWFAMLCLTLLFGGLTFLLAISEPLGPRLLALHRQGKKGQAMLAVAFGCAGFVLFGLGSVVVLRAYDSEQRNADSKRQAEDALRGDLAAARAANEAAESRRRRQVEKTQIVATRIAEAIDAGTGLRYKFEHEYRSDAAKFGGRFPAHETAIETWRAETAVMLDGELPGLRLGASFSAVDGIRGSSEYDWSFTRLSNCVEMLREIQSKLPDYVERLVQ